MRDTIDLPLDVATALSQGARARQEDALAVAFPEGADHGFAVLSDGMGGHAAGDLASRVIVSEVIAELTLHNRAAAFDATNLPRLLRHAVQMANGSLRAHVDASSGNQGMGGTVVATAVSEGQLYWASVGDSLLYLYRDGRLTRLNDDHSMAPQIDLLVAKGLMDAEVARTHPQRSCLTSAVMGEPIAEIDCPETPFDLEAGDLVVVASDGLQYLRDSAIAATLEGVGKVDGRQIADALMAEIAALDDPEQDNVSLIVIKAPEPKISHQTLPIWRAPAAAIRAFGRVLTPRWLHRSQE